MSQIYGELHKSDYWSFKLKKPALITQFAIAADKRVEWVSSSSRPAGRWNDPKQFKEELDSYLCDDQDITCFDGVYGKIDSMRQLLPHRKPKGRELSAKQKHENDEIAEFRGDIERVFGAATKKLAIFDEIWQHGEKTFNFEITKGTHWKHLIKKLTYNRFCTVECRT